ncbi:MAG: hypothetical protein ABFQ65_00285 [Nanoarchaeota archaeon]
MELTTLPKNIVELKQIILETINEVSERFIPFISQDEQEEIEKIHGKNLEEEYNKEDYMKI